MSMGQKQRWTLLLAVLGLSVLAAVWVGQEEETAEPVQAARPVTLQGGAANVTVTADKGIGLKMGDLSRAAREDEAGDLFAAKSWYVPPPPPKPVPPPPPPPPSAPPLPFSFLGKMVDDGHMTVYLSKDGRNYVVKAGETIDGMYQVEEIGPRMMTLVYLPLNIKQTLMIGGE